MLIILLSGILKLNTDDDVELLSRQQHVVTRVIKSYQKPGSPRPRHRHSNHAYQLTYPNQDPRIRIPPPLLLKGTAYYYN